MKLSDILTETSLNVTPEHIRQAKGNKQNFVVEMFASDFLELTTSSEESLQQIINNCQATDVYNKAAADGENIIMPFLHIEGNKVVGHEGRHRAASLLCKDKHARMKVAIKYRPGDEEEKEKLSSKHGVWRIDYDVDIDDLPKMIYGQFGRGLIMTRHLDFIQHLQK